MCTRFIGSQLICSLLASLAALTAQAQKKTEIEIHGQVWLTTDYNFQSQDPNWFEMLRPSKISNDKGEAYAGNGNFSVGVRPSRFGIQVRQATEKGMIKTQFDFDLVGNGNNVGQTSFRLFNAYVEWNGFAFGKKNSVFMDGAVVPSTVDFFGPCGMVLLRNAQISYKAIDTKEHEVMVGLENPNATSDLGQYGADFDFGNRLNNMRFITKAPAVAAHYKRNFPHGHIQVAALAKYTAWNDGDKTATQDLSGSTWGYGANITGAYKPLPQLQLLGAFVAGKGIQNYLNDGTADIGVQRNYANSFQPIIGKPIPFISFMGYATYGWNKYWSTTVGYSAMHHQTFNTQLNNALQVGGYATVNLLYKPTPQFTFGIEYQHAHRRNTNFIGDAVFALPAAAGKSFAIHKVQAMLVYKFSSL